MDIISSNKTIAEFVKENYKTADVFKRYSIDFCCGGKRSLEDVCEKKNLDMRSILLELGSVVVKSEKINDYDFWDLDKLTSHIIETHHKYVRENAELIIQYSDKVAKVHGNHNPKLIEITDLFKKLSEELMNHMMKEEMILFPYINHLVSSNRFQLKPEKPMFGEILNPVSMMEHEHDEAGELIKQIRMLAEDYTLPDWACNTYKVLFFKLEEFEADLFKHIHLENNILFPKAIELEKSLT